MEVQTKKRGWIIFAALLLLLCLAYAGRDWIGTVLKAESGKEHVQIEFDAKTAGDHIDKLLKSRWDNIFFHIQFAPDETAFVHVEFKNENKYTK